MRVRVVQPAREAERLKPLMSVLDDIFPLVVVEPLLDSTGRSIDHQPHAPDVVGDEAVARPTAFDVVRDVALAAVDEDIGDLVARVHQRHRRVAS